VLVFGETRPIPPRFLLFRQNVPSFCPDLVKIVSKFDQNTRFWTPNQKYFDAF
jgi:hypothetical protein